MHGTNSDQRINTRVCETTNTICIPGNPKRRDILNLRLYLLFFSSTLHMPFENRQLMQSWNCCWWKPFRLSRRKKKWLQHCSPDYYLLFLTKNNNKKKSHHKWMRIFKFPDSIYVLASGKHFKVKTWPLQEALTKLCNPRLKSTPLQVLGPKENITVFLRLNSTPISYLNIIEMPKKSLPKIYLLLNSIR